MSFDAFLDPIEDQRMITDIHSRKEDHELIPAGAGNHILLPESSGSQDLSCCFDGIVTGIVAMLVVDFFQIIKITGDD